MSISQATLLRDMVERFGLGRAGTATSASTTTLVDAPNFGGPQMGGMFPNGSPLRVTSGAGINGKSRRSAIDPSTGTITFDPLITGNTGTPTFVISNVVDDIDRIIEAINRTLEEDCTFWQPIPVTSIPDGDFLGDTVTDAFRPTETPPAGYKEPKPMVFNESHLVGELWFDELIRAALPRTRWWSEYVWRHAAAKPERIGPELLGEVEMALSNPKEHVFQVTDEKDESSQIVFVE
jgi:hypothetical protein